MAHTTFSLSGVCEALRNCSIFAVPLAAPLCIYRLSQGQILHVYFDYDFDNVFRLFLSDNAASVSVQFSKLLSHTQISSSYQRISPNILLPGTNVLQMLKQ